MHKQLRLSIIWCVLAGVVLVMTTSRGEHWIGHVTDQYCPNRWVHFLLYAAVTAIPCAKWRTKRWLLCCFSVVGACIAYGLIHIIVSGPNVDTEGVVSNLFGVAAGVLLGLNLRYSRNHTKAVPGLRAGGGAQRRPKSAPGRKFDVQPTNTVHS
jgi:hypothetical protein